MRIPVPIENAYHLINHGPCNLITTGDGTRRNVAPINWTMPLLDDPPLVVMAVEPGIYTDELLRDAGEFAVNLMGEKCAGQVLFCGKRSGRKVDKFKESGLQPVSCLKIKAPRVGQSLAHLECRVEKVVEHEEIRLYIGRVLHAEVEEEFYDGKHLRAELAKTIHHVGGGIFAITDRVITVPREKI